MLVHTEMTSVSKKKNQDKKHGHKKDDCKNDEVLQPPSKDSGLEANIFKEATKAAIVMSLESGAFPREAAKVMSRVGEKTLVETVVAAEKITESTVVSATKEITEQTILKGGKKVVKRTVAAAGKKVVKRTVAAAGKKAAKETISTAGKKAAKKAAKATTTKIGKQMLRGAKAGLVAGALVEGLSLGYSAYNAWDKKGDEFAAHMGKQVLKSGGSLAGGAVGAAIGTVIFPGVGTVVGNLIGSFTANIVISACCGN